MQVLHSEEDAIAAIATPAGEGAIGIVRVSGKEAVRIASACLRFPGNGVLETLPKRQSALGVFVKDGIKIDRVMATVFRAPHSYTGDDVVEIACHGSPIVLKEVLQTLIEKGARPAEPGEFSRRAFLNGKMDLSQAEAVADLIQSRTELSRSAAFAQLEGGVSRAANRMKSGLVEILTHIEVEIDHSDDDTAGVTLSKEEVRQRLETLAREASSLIQSFEFGRIVREGVKIAIVGKPNAGKSSLLNCLLKAERAIVHPLPGTTRDTIEESFDLEGLKAVLIDTAGIRAGASDPVEISGIERTAKSIQSADAVIAVLDSSAPLNGDDRRIADLVRDRKGLAVLNKADLPSKMNFEEAGYLFPDFLQVKISVLKGEGVGELVRALAGAVLLSKKTAGAFEEEAIVCSVRHRDCLVRMRGSIERALGLLKEDSVQDLLAFEVRESLDALGEMVGEVVTEDILQEIFSKFCIGK